MYLCVCGPIAKKPPHLHQAKGVNVRGHERLHHDGVVPAVLEEGRHGSLHSVRAARYVLLVQLEAAYSPPMHSLN